MKRFMGMMPNECVEISKIFKDEEGNTVHIEAGPEGWSIIYMADHSCTFKDVNTTSEENFKSAFNIANEISKLTPIDTESDEELGEC